MLTELNVAGVMHAIDNPKEGVVPPLWDSHATERIVDIIRNLRPFDAFPHLLRCLDFLCCASCAGTMGFVDALPGGADCVQLANIINQRCGLAQCPCI